MMMLLILPLLVMLRAVLADHVTGDAASHDTAHSAVVALSVAVNAASDAVAVDEAGDAD